MSWTPVPRSPARGGLHGRIIVITRPVGTAAALARRVRARGGVPLLLPGLALRAPDDAAAAWQALEAALRSSDLLVFVSPMAVRFAAALGPLRSCAGVVAVGQATARALERHGVSAQVPMRQDSEGLLALLTTAPVHGKSVTMIGASGGRDLLPPQLRARGAQVGEVAVYRRVAPRLDRRHVEALASLPASARVLLSSAQSLGHLHALLPPMAWARLCAATAVTSSERLAAAARAAGFRRIRQAASALADDLLAAAG